MSWCRWGSPCDGTFPIQFEEDKKCVEHGCPGSSVYIFSIGDDLYECCGCSIEGRHETYQGDYEHMLAHVFHHHKQGHHVRRSLLTAARRFFRGELAS